MGHHHDACTNVYVEVSQAKRRRRRRRADDTAQYIVGGILLEVSSIFYCQYQLEK